jgi:hypothetical protein
MNRLLGHRYSHETISAMTEEVLQAVEAFRRRPLPEEMAFVYLDGLYLKLLREGEGVVREVVYVALGVTPSGERQVLGYWLLPAESALGWEGVLGELWQRGLRRVLLFIWVGEARREVGGAAASRSEHLVAQGVLGGEGDAGEDASGAVCPPYTNAYTYILTRPGDLVIIGQKEAPAHLLQTPEGRLSGEKVGEPGRELVEPALRDLKRPHGPTSAPKSTTQAGCG